MGGGRRPWGVGTRHNLAPLLIAIAWQILAMSALERSPRFLTPVLPLACVVLGIAAAPGLARLARRRALIAVFTAIVLERGANVIYQRGDAHRRFPPVGPATESVLAERIRGWPPAGPVLSAAPHWAPRAPQRPAPFLSPLRQLHAVIT